MQSTHLTLSEISVPSLFVPGLVLCNVIFRRHASLAIVSSSIATRALVGVIWCAPPGKPFRLLS